MQKELLKKRQEVYFILHENELPIKVQLKSKRNNKWKIEYKGYTYPFRYNEQSFFDNELNCLEDFINKYNLFNELYGHINFNAEVKIDNNGNLTFISKQLKQIDERLKNEHIQFEYVEIDKFQNRLKELQN